MLKKIIQHSIKKIFPYIGIELNRASNTQSLLRIEYMKILESTKEKTPDNPCLYGYKCYSQFDEDGIINHITTKLKINQGVFVEFGCGDGLENNTHLLLLKGWKGLWVDGSEHNFNFIKSNIPISSSQLVVNNEFITLDNVNNVITSALLKLESKEIDLLSMDLDGNDIYLLEKILSTENNLSPKIIVAEYNGKMPFGLEISVPYVADSWRDGDDYYGVSLSMLVNKLTNYSLVTCGISGVNAYFVRNDLLSSFTIYEPKDLYQPARVHMTLMTVGSKPSLKYLANILKNKT